MTATPSETPGVKSSLHARQLRPIAQPIWFGHKQSCRGYSNGLYKARETSSR